MFHSEEVPMPIAMNFGHREVNDIKLARWPWLQMQSGTRDSMGPRGVPGLNQQLGL